MGKEAKKKNDSGSNQRSFRLLGKSQVCYVSKLTLNCINSDLDHLLKCA